jgi:hypothetical protein
MGSNENTRALAGVRPALSELLTQVLTLSPLSPISRTY